MDRETRKANLKKLQLSSSSGNKTLRNTRQIAKSRTTSNTAITGYFFSPEKNEQETSSPQKVSPADLNLRNNEAVGKSPDIKLKTDISKRTKRTKLDAFIFKDPNNISDNNKKSQVNSLNDEDFVVPEKKAKKAPKVSLTKRSKSSRAKRQTTIKSAFLRNEQMFAEIAAQHCAADLFDGDDVQLALAISRSEAESNGVGLLNENVQEIGNNLGGEESIREKLKKYGFRTAEKEDYNTFTAAFLPKIFNRRAKSKWANKFTALTLRSSEIQLKKLQQNIEKLLNSQFHSIPLNEHQEYLPDYQLQSCLLKKSTVQGNKRILHIPEYENPSNDMFFVTELFEINRIPAGHLLKDWSDIQGRDLSPCQQKNKQSIQRLKVLQKIYEDLEEFFGSHKILDWTKISDNKEEISIKLEMRTNKQENQKEDSPAANKNNFISSKTAEKTDNEKINDILEANKEADAENRKINVSCNNKILQLLPTSKPLDMMQVSSCSLNTQATINTTQKTRSSSPDLFADSDAELEDADKPDGDDKYKDEIVENVSKDNYGKNFLDNIGDEVTTYEIFSSDEVKNTSSEVNKSTVNEMLQNRLSQSNNNIVIDLTQNDIQLPVTTNSNNNFNQSKTIEDIDLFAESPLQEDPDVADTKISNQNKDETLQFTSSVTTNDKKELIIEKKNQDCFDLIPLLENQKQKFPINENDDAVVLREMAVDQSNITLLNLLDSKQLQENFHRRTATVVHEILKDNLNETDAGFRELCNKYLNHQPLNTFTANGEQKTDSTKSYSKNFPTSKTPEKCDNFTNFTIDFEMTVNEKETLQNNTAKTSLKKDSSPILSNSQLLNKLNPNVSIDLTQDDSEDDDNVELSDEDDACLVLSDDEINYSIWQADKTLNFPTSLPSNNTTDNEDFTDIKHIVSDKENIVEFSNQHNDNKQLSYLDLEDMEKSMIKVTLGPEESISDFEVLTSKYTTTSSSPNHNEPIYQRSEFGILEEYSEPIEYATNLCTPTKELTDASFLSSPTETSAPMKLYSSRHGSSQKFQDLLNNIQVKSPAHDAVDDLNDFDEFDPLVCTSPLKSAKSSKKPEGIDLLLTEEITFKETQKLSDIKKSSSPKTSENNAQEIEYNNRIYTVRYCSTPKPDYTKYSEAQLLKELYNFGIKPLKRKQAVKMLEYIYNQTHPILMQEKEVLNEKEQNDFITLDDFERPCTSKEALLKAKSCTNLINTANESVKEGTKNVLEVTSKKFNLQDSCGVEMLRYSVDLKAELTDENYIFQTNVTKKTSQPLLPFHIAWYNLVCSNRKLHEAILTYQPIDLQEIYLFLKSLGYRYDPKDLKLFFDRRCIIFRYDLARAAGSNGRVKDSNRHVRKSKKTQNQ